MRARRKMNRLDPGIYLDRPPSLVIEYDLVTM